MKKCISTVGLFMVIFLSATGIQAGSAPDFNNPGAVFDSLNRMTNQCAKSNASLCVTRCKYATTTLKNFIRLNPEGDPSIFKQRWQPCFEEYQKAGFK